MYWPAVAGADLPFLTSPIVRLSPVELRALELMANGVPVEAALATARRPLRPLLSHVGVLVEMAEDSLWPALMVPLILLTAVLTLTAWVV